jgi:hypothetical protein
MNKLLENLQRRLGAPGSYHRKGGAMSPPLERNLLFARGFLFSEARSEVHQDWRETKAGKYWLYYDPRVSVFVHSHGCCEVSILGIVNDPFDPHADEPQICMRLAMALSSRREDFLDAVDRLSGRFVVIFRRNETTEIVGDATCMRTIYYTGDGPFAASSHASIIAAVRNSPYNPAYGRYLYSDEYQGWVEHYLPGAMTPWLGVRSLTANCALNCSTRAIARIWPRRSIRSRSVEDVSEELCTLFRGQVENLVNRNRPVLVSLTGGMDSRTTLSVAHSYGDKIKYFTYGGPERTARDVKKATELASQLGLDHKVVEMADEIPAFWKAVFDSNGFNRHRRGLPPVYATHFSDDTIHIRTNLAEIGRAYYYKIMNKKAAILPKQPSVQFLARLWWNAPNNLRASAAAEFRNRTDETGFWSVDAVDLYDLFYWEHRMSCWHGGVVMESDTAFDTVSLFNCRYILEALLSVPLADRVSDSVQRHAIRALCPSIAPAPPRARSSEALTPV